MQIKPGTFCPLIKKDCVGIKCGWFTQIRGKNPNTNEDIDEWGCAITWLPILLIDNSNQQRKTTATLDSLRGEVYEQQVNNAKVLKSVVENNIPISMPINLIEGNIE